MGFYQKFELLEPLPGGDIKSFNARETATGRLVIAHLMVAGHTPQNDELLRAIGALPPEWRAHIVEAGEHEGTPYVVTDRMTGPALADWVRAAPAAAPKPAVDPMLFTRAGAWKIPVQPHAAAPPPAAAEPGEFTRMFQAG